MLGALAEESADAHRVLGARTRGDPADRREPRRTAPEAAEVDALIKELGWNVHESAPARSALADTLASLRGLGSPLEWRVLLPYARLAEETAVLDLDQLEGIQDPLELAERALLLTVLLEPALLALRRMAQAERVGPAACRHDGQLTSLAAKLVPAPSGRQSPAARRSPRSASGNCQYENSRFLRYRCRSTRITSLTTPASVTAS